MRSINKLVGGFQDVYGLKKVSDSLGEYTRRTGRTKRADAFINRLMCHRSAWVYTRVNKDMSYKGTTVLFAGRFGFISLDTADGTMASGTRGSDSVITLKTDTTFNEMLHEWGAVIAEEEKEEYESCNEYDEYEEEE